MQPWKSSQKARALWKIGLFAVALMAVLATATCVRDSRDLRAMRTTRPRQPSGVAARSWPLCSLVGPRNGIEGIYGTDLGFTAHTENADKLAMLFGDTWARPVDACEYPTLPSDDLQGWLPRTRPSVFQAGPPNQKGPVSCNLLEVPKADPESPTAPPRIRLFPNPVARSPDSVMDMSSLRTPEAAFSDGERLYGIFFRDDPAYCSSTTECSNGMQCSSDPSYAGPKLGECSPTMKLSPDASPTYCRTSDDCGSPAQCGKAGRGVCLATKPFDLDLPGGRVVPTWYHDDVRRGVARVLYVGAALWPDHPLDYGTVARFVTNRFQNLTVKSVAFFDPSHPEKNDYRPGYHTLLIWGRVAFVEVDGAQALPFLAYQPLDTLRGSPENAHFAPRFFAGYDKSGNPAWSDHENDAQPIYGTDAKLVAADGGVKLDWREPEIDYVSQMTVSYVAPLGRWLMFYGGDLPAFMVLRSSGRARDPVHLPFAPGAIHMRLAQHPWGAATRSDAIGGWSSPEPVLTRQTAAPYMACGDDPEAMPGCLKEGDPHTPLELFGTLAGLAVTEPSKLAKVGPSCVGGEFVHGAQDVLSGNRIGRLYGVNLIDDWAEEIDDPAAASSGERAAEVYWNASTWNPYQVVLVKTRISARPLSTGRIRSDRGSPTAAR
jgi:hypothetical protein